MSRVWSSPWWDSALDVAIRRCQNTGRKHAVRWDAQARVWRVKPAVIR